MTAGEPPDLVVGWTSEEVRAEFPRLGLASLTLDAASGRSPRGVRRRLRELSDRFRGAGAVTMRQDPVPAAYRIFFRQIGLDPDDTRTPAEGAALQRLMAGEFRSENLLDDALTISLVETGVPIWALDATAVEGPLGIRQSGPDERLGRAPEAPYLPATRLVVADARSPLAVLFGDLAPQHGVSERTTRMTLFSVRVGGVPAIHVEEALWSCFEVLRAV